MTVLTIADHQREYVTVAEVAAQVGCSEPTVRRRIRDGSIPAVKLGSGRNNALHVPRSGLESWLWSGPGEAA